MDSTTTISLGIVVAALVGIYMHSRRILRPAIQTVVGPNNLNSAVVPSIGTLAVASVGYLVVLSFLDAEDGYLLTMFVILGALLIDSRTAGNKDLIHTLLTPAKKG